MTNEEKDKKEYELALLLRSEEDLAGVLTLANQHGAESVSEPRAKRLQLAYEIKNVNDAVFVYMTFKAYGDEIKALEQDLNTHNEVLRFMVIASPAPTERPSATGMPHERRSASPSAPKVGVGAEPRASAPRPLSNEALEKKIEEILQ